MGKPVQFTFKQPYLQDLFWNIYLCYLLILALSGKEFNPKKMIRRIWPTKELAKKMIGPRKIVVIKTKRKKVGLSLSQASYKIVKSPKGLRSFLSLRF